MWLTFQLKDEPEEMNPRHLEIYLYKPSMDPYLLTKFQTDPTVLSLSKVDVTEPTPSLLPQFCQNDRKSTIF
jgi:hypothetical protein